MSTRPLVFSLAGLVCTVACGLLAAAPQAPLIAAARVPIDVTDVAASRPRDAVPASPQTLRTEAVKLPYTFVANDGQTDPAVRFLARGPGYTLFLTPAEAVLALRPNVPDAGSATEQRKQRSPQPARTADIDAAGKVLRLSLVGADPAPVIAGEAPLPGKVNVLRGNDPEHWRTGIDTFAKVRYQGVYPGIDVVYYGNGGELEYDFVLAPGADPSAIRLAFSGADAMRLDEAGNLVLTLGDHEVLQRQPQVYQERDGPREFVSARYRLADNGEVTVALDRYDRARTLIVDPVLEYSTYLGGRNGDVAIDIAVDAAGNAYVTGETRSIDFPTRRAEQAAIKGSVDAFVSKLSADGTLVYSTYLGGTGVDEGFGIAVDGDGSAYVTGETTSPDFPLRNSLKPAIGGYWDAFVTKLSADGTALVYSTLLGGRQNDEGEGIAVDANGHAYVTGRTFSRDFPTRNAFQPHYAGAGYSDGDAFATKLSADGSALVYSTYLGGSDWDNAVAIAIDNGGNASITGSTYSIDFPIRNAFQPIHPGKRSTFVSRLSADGRALVYSTYLGGSGNWDEATDIAVDAAGNAYVTGYTDSYDFPIRNAFQSSHGGGANDAYITKLQADGNALVYSTYLGGSVNDVGGSIATDAAGNAYVAGSTYSTDFPRGQVAEGVIAGSMDAFITRLSADGTALTYSMYYGGKDMDVANAIALDAIGNGYIAGYTYSDDLPTRGAVQPARRGEADAFIAKLVADDLPPITATPMRLLALDAIDAVIAALLREGTAAYAVVHDALGAAPRRIDFDPAYAAVDFERVPDLDGNGTPELALLGRHADGRVQVELRDSLSGALLGKVPFDAAFAPLHLAVLPDRNGNGAAELAVLGVKLGGAVTATIKDAAGGQGLGRVYYGKTLRPVAFAAVHDVDGNGAPELALLGDKTDLTVRAVLRDSLTGAAIRYLWAPKWTSPIGLGVLPDSNANSAPELAMLGRGRFDRAGVLVKTADTASGEQLGAVFFDPALAPLRLAPLADLDGNGVAEIALLAANADQTAAVVRDAASGSVIRSLRFNALRPADIAVLPDLDGNGAPEVAVLGTLKATGAPRVMIRDALTGALTGTLDF